MKSILHTLALLFFVLLFSQCQRERFTTSMDDRLTFGSDTVWFDTIFTGIGSSINGFVVKNTSNKSIRIDNIFLGGGVMSPYRLNIDGVATRDTFGVEIGPKDSVWVFVEVTINPDLNPHSFIAEDSIVFVTNGNVQQVKLLAFGQNAHFHIAEEICDAIWEDDLPHVIINSVLVNEGCNLTIEKGTDIYTYGGSRIFVQGDLIVNGEIDSVVNFYGGTLDTAFHDVKGQWDGIHILRNGTGNINYADITGPVIGIRVDSLPSMPNTPNLEVRNTIIRNTASSGILGITANILGENLLIYNCGQSALQMEFGGIYNFINTTCTTIEGNQYPLVRMGNYLAAGLQIIGLADLNVRLSNCLAYSFNSAEVDIEIDEVEDPAVVFDVLVENSLFKSTSNANHPQYSNVILNTDPLFVNEESLDFHLQAGSPCIDAGLFGLQVPTTDLEGNFRVGIPDIGCYEMQ